MDDLVPSLTKRAAVGAALLIAVGCGGGGESLGPAPNADIGGDWVLNWTNMSGTVSGAGTISCDLSGFHATINQTGTSFTGQGFGTWTLSCLGGGQSGSEMGSGGVISSGTVTGNHVHFHLATEDASQDGTVEGNSMSGTSTWRLDLGSPYGVLILKGQWAGVRSTDTPTGPTSGNAPPPTPNPTSDISIVLGASTKTTTAFSPNPKSMSLSGGASVTIRWINEDIAGSDYQTGTATAHQIMSDNGAFGTSPPLAGNATYSVSLSSAGTYTYHCAIHPNMVGAIQVTP